jgi:hypothetical protein
MYSSADAGGTNERTTMLMELTACALYLMMFVVVGMLFAVSAANEYDRRWK